MSSQIDQPSLLFLATLEKDQLRALWEKTFGPGFFPAALRKDLLARGLAYERQVRSDGGLTRHERLALIALAEGKQRRRQPNIKPGTRLLRLWQGETHEVTVTESGYLWGETAYRSLSEIARNITGSRWSGPRFFGLRVE